MARVLGKDETVTQRIWVIDFFRGAALFLIFWNHLAYLAGATTRIRYGFSDAAEVFVFLSGIVAGIVYGKVRDSVGFWALWKKGVRRSLEIYAAYVATLVVLLLIDWILPPLPAGDAPHRYLARFSSESFVAAKEFLTLQFSPANFGTLPLYMTLVLVLPVFMVSIRSHPRVGLLLVVLVYCATQSVASVGGGFGLRSWFFNPFAWQFLFFIGVLLGDSYRRGRLVIPRHPAIVVASWSIAGISFVLSATLPGLSGLRHHFQNVLPSAFPGVEKHTLGPVLVLNFAALAYLGWWYAAKIDSLSSTRVGGWISGCGRRSLLVFSTGIVLGYTSSYLAQLSPLGGAMIYLVGGLDMAILVIIGQLSFPSAAAFRRTMLLRLRRSDGQLESEHQLTS